MSLVYEGLESSLWDTKSGVRKYNTLNNPNFAAAELFYGKRLAHPNVTRTFNGRVETGLPEGWSSELTDSKMHDGLNYVQEMDKGIPLAEMRFTSLASLIASLFDALCGLRALHSNNLAYMNLSSSNIVVFLLDSGVRTQLSGLSRLQDARLSNGVSDLRVYEDTKGMPNALRDLSAFCRVAIAVLGKHAAQALAQSSQQFDWYDTPGQIFTVLENVFSTSEGVSQIQSEILEGKIDYQEAVDKLDTLLVREHSDAMGARSLQCESAPNLLLRDDAKAMRGHRFAALYSQWPDAPELQAIWQEYCQNGSRPDPECFYAELMSMRLMGMRQLSSTAQTYRELASQFAPDTNRGWWARWIVDFVTREPSEFPREPDADFIEVLQRFRTARKRKRDD